MDIFQQVLQSFSERHSFNPALNFDNANICDLFIDQQIAISIRRDVDNQRLTLITQLAPALPENLTDEWVEKALTHACHPMDTNKPGVGWSEQIGLTAYIHISQVELNLEVFEHYFADLIEYNKEWNSAHNNDTPPPPSSGDSSDDDVFQNAIFA